MSGLLHRSIPGGKLPGKLVTNLEILFSSHCIPLGRPMAERFITLW